MPENLKSRWALAATPVRAAIVAGLVIAALIFALKILPYLVAAMGVGMLLALLFLPYWTPTIIAFARHHPSRGAVFALNFLLGWTFIGWVASFVWSLSDATARTQSVVVQTTINPTIAMTAHGDEQPR